MSNTAPHYLLLTRANSGQDRSGEERNPGGSWSFILERIGDQNRIEVADEEPAVKGERLDLLAVVRGLEALEQPSRVTLITPSSYVGRGFRGGLKSWIENDFRWKRFGELVPVSNADLWKRVAVALQFHTIDCRVWQFETSGRSARRMALPSLIRPPADFQPLPDEFQPQQESCGLVTTAADDTTAAHRGIGEHAAKAGIVYRHYAASATIRDRPAMEVAPAPLKISGQPAQDDNPAALTCAYEADSEHPSQNSRRPRQIRTPGWSRITRRIAEQISETTMIRPRGLMTPA